MLVNIQYNLTDITVPLPNTTISNYGMSQDMVLMLTYSEESPIFQMCFTYMSSTACETPHGWVTVWDYLDTNIQVDWARAIKKAPVDQG